MRKILKAIGVIFIVLILFLTFYSIVATVTKNNVSIPRSEETKPSATEQIFIPVPRYCSIGDTVTLNGVKVTLVNAFKVKPNNQFDLPTRGNILLAVLFNITNDTEEDIVISSVSSFEAYFDGHECHSDLNVLIAAAGDNQIDGTVAPGKTVSGIIGYEIPNDWQEFEIHYQPKPLGDNIIFTIKRGD